MKIQLYTKETPKERHIAINTNKDANLTELWKTIKTIRGNKNI